jgi:hypothetical protein
MGIYIQPGVQMQADSTKEIKEVPIERICPNCGKELEERSCKLICNTPGCGYHVSCADII